ncbi:hypothetical protein CLV59_101386 [Chitinophaga dinghuensis]|uniref:Methyltransferase family protein n=1 Tax=Chitinophaga dinghuensis TaxID=1539050 RepID=A0A327WAQ7_9BACT|nr:class I SAM-dependent methyltransferase [Chitinophaga dinghuensis]RAJ87625.1 hypothetical protein CLV59_101386 [Chitinophaga dinghuensis]
MEFSPIIDRQLAFHANKNICNVRQLATMEFTPEMRRFIAEKRVLSPALADRLIGYIVDNVLRQFYQVNQYFAFPGRAVEELRKLYIRLMEEIYTDEAAVVSPKHYMRLRNWLCQWNPFADQLYTQAPDEITPVVCAEYQARLQLQVLQLSPENITGPLLDIGCGEHASLVKYLRSIGVQAVGIDRMPPQNSVSLQYDWLEFPYGTAQWGTIVSHLGFSNHFHHHHLREDGDFRLYAARFMDMLSGLKPGGSFHYAPGLPVIERFLNRQDFQVETFPTGHHDFTATVITKLR